METLADIEAAVRRLSVSDRLRLVESVVKTLPIPHDAMPLPRTYEEQTIRGWIAQDERDMDALRSAK